jgi:glycosyltransferase involved in cell wall biosynthesis
LKIVIIGPAWPLRGGIANFNEALGLDLQDKGHSVKIISFSLQYPSLLFPGKSQTDSTSGKPNLDIEALINSIQPFTWFSAAKRIRDYAPDLVIIRYWLPFMAPALGTIARLCRKKGHKIPVIGLTDNIVPHESRPFDRALTGYFLKKCDGFLVMSEQVSNDLRSFGIDVPVKKRYHPIYDIFGSKVERSAARKKLGIDEGKKLILFFGFIRKYKGLDLLLQAMADERLIDIHLIVAGEFYEDRGYYDEIVRSGNIKDRVVMKGEYIPKEAVRYYFSAADLVVQPYRSATQSGVTQIAYHFGVPMVVTDTGGLPEMVENGVAGLVVDESDVSIASAIDRFFSDSELRNQLEEGVIKNASLFSWDQMSDGILELYESINRTKVEN